MLEEERSVLKTADKADWPERFKRTEELEGSRSLITASTTSSAGTEVEKEESEDLRSELEVTIAGARESESPLSRMMFRVKSDA
jgi:hypothetical protein